MPYEITWEKKGIRWRFYGVVTSEESVASNLEIYGDPRFDSIRYQIADFSEVTDIRFLEKDMKKIAYLDQAASRSNPRIKVAIISKTEKVQTLLEQYAQYSAISPWEIRLFDSVKCAESWLSETLVLKIG